jgi:anti-sigma factor RsiW
MGRDGKHPQLTERYVLGELSDDERGAFEAHLFECAACAADVITADRLIEGIRAGAAAPIVRASRFSMLRAWLAAPRVAWAATAAVVLVAAPLALYQGLVTVPRLEHELELRDRPRAVAPVTVRRPTRGTGKVVGVTRDDRAVVVAVELPPGARDVALSGELLRADGATVLPSFALAAPAPGEPLVVQLPTRPLAPGAYDLILRGDARELSRYPFVLERR